MSTKDLVYKRLQARTKVKFTDASDIFKLGIDSLDLVDMVTDIEGELKIRIADAELIAMKTVGDVVQVVEKALADKNKK